MNRVRVFYNDKYNTVAPGHIWCLRLAFSIGGNAAVSDRAGTRSKQAQTLKP